MFRSAEVRLELTAYPQLQLPGPGFRPEPGLARPSQGSLSPAGVVHWLLTHLTVHPPVIYSWN